ncbi:MAG: GntR family transcriptional regulator [Pseudomonadota bacterium]
MSHSAEKLIAQIKQEIADGVLKPGDQLEEAILAERFAVSRTPVREAVRSMVDAGLLERRPRKGAFVRCLTAKELLDLFEVAAELEGMACRLAANLMTRRNAEHIRAALSQCKEAAQDGDTLRYGQANLTFHRAIQEASGNGWLIYQLRQMDLHINPYRGLPYEVRGRLKQSMKEHQEIYETIMSGDADHARNLMHDHMLLQGQRLPSLLQALEVS